MQLLDNCVLKLKSIVHKKMGTIKKQFPFFLQYKFYFLIQRYAYGTYQILVFDDERVIFEIGQKSVDKRFLACFIIS